jgi:hypothetical protein
VSFRPYGISRKAELVEERISKRIEKRDGAFGPIPFLF